MRFQVLLALLIAPVAMFAQGGAGTISGSATDATGAVVPGTVVTAINEETGFKRDTTVGAAGEYSLVGLNRGSTRLRPSRKGSSESR